MNLRCLSRGKQRQASCNIADYINRDLLAAACHRAPVPHADAPPHLSGQ